MTREEFAMFAMALKTYYPKENILPNEQSMELWLRQLEDIPFKVAEVSLNKWVALNKWSPAISDIREMASEIINGQIPSLDVAWAEVRQAIRDFGSARPQEALESMSPLTRETVESIGFVKICMSERPDVEWEKFKKLYEIKAKRAKEDNQTPLITKNMITSVSQKRLEVSNV